MTWERPACCHAPLSFFGPFTRWSQGITSRPWYLLRVSWMPFPGPVAYQFQSFAFTDVVISRGLDQVRPSSCDESINTPSLSRLKGSQSVPVCCSTTGQGLPIV